MASRCANSWRPNWASAFSNNALEPHRARFVVDDRGLFLGRSDVASPTGGFPRSSRLHATCSRNRNSSPPTRSPGCRQPDRQEIGHHAFVLVHRLDGRQRRIVEETIEDHCRIRGWALHAVNCRSNHLHVVVTADRHPDEVRKQLKAWTVRKLSQARKRPATSDRSGVRAKWWAERGSRQYINDENSLEAVVLYVRDAQDAIPRPR